MKGLGNYVSKHLFGRCCFHTFRTHVEGKDGYILTSLWEPQSSTPTFFACKLDSLSCRSTQLPRIYFDYIPWSIPQINIFLMLNRTESPSSGLDVMMLGEWHEIYIWWNPVAHPLLSTMETVCEWDILLDMTGVCPLWPISECTRSTSGEISITPALWRIEHDKLFK